MAVAVGFRRQVRVGPALRIAPLPVAGLTLSAIGHAALITLLVIAVQTLKEHQPRTYVVNLVPAVAALGSPQGQSSTPVPPVARAPELPPTPPAKTESPVRDVPPRDVSPRDLPPRDLPPRQRSGPLALPDRALPARAPAAVAPRTEQKELPTVASSTTPTQAPAIARGPAAVPTPAAPPPPPAQTAGQLTGSPQGAGKITLDVDFPYAWYLRVITQKINEKWEGKALPGNQPQVVFEITRDGRVNLGRLRIEKPSGNPLYDRAALRAIEEAMPFPPLPEDFKAEYLRLHIGFDHRQG